MDISDRIKIVRGKLSQDEFAQKLGVHKNSLGRYERGNSVPGVDVAEKICFVFGVNPQWLLLGSGPMLEEDDGQKQEKTHAPPAGEPPRAQVDESLKQMEIKEERLWQMVERERELLKEVGELKAKNARLEERITAREQALRDLRDLYEL